MNERGLRLEIVSCARRMNALGINQGTSGNVSARADDAMLITPSAVPYEAMEADDVIRMPLDGDAPASAGGRRPSTEWRMHAGILRARTGVGAIVHAHSTHATALACLRRDIPPFHYMVAVAGGRDIRCAAYATFGTPELARNALAALEGRRACLLANHGIIACGTTPAEALALAVEVEALAAQYLAALAVGEPELLDDAEMDRVLEAFRDYGRPAS